MPHNAMDGLLSVINERKAQPIENSYTCYLFNEGIDKILKKCGEECSEIIIAAKNADKDEIKNEICDFLYHVLVLMAEMDISYEEIEEILNERRKKIGNKKLVKASDKDS